MDSVKNPLQLKVSGLNYPRELESQGVVELINCKQWVLLFFLLCFAQIAEASLLSISVDERNLWMTGFEIGEDDSHHWVDVYTQERDLFFEPQTSVNVPGEEVTEDWQILAEEWVRDCTLEGFLIAEGLASECSSSEDSYLVEYGDVSGDLQKDLVFAFPQRASGKGQILVFIGPIDWEADVPYTSLIVSEGLDGEAIGSRLALRFLNDDDLMDIETNSFDDDENLVIAFDEELFTRQQVTPGAPLTGSVLGTYGCSLDAVNRDQKNLFNEYLVFVSVFLVLFSLRRRVS